MTVLVTGASGFLGGALARILVEQGEQVRCLVRPTSDTAHLDHLPINYVTGDLGDRAALSEAVEDASIIYHCAALSGDWGRWEEFEAANVTGVANLLAAARTLPGLQRFLHVSTTDVYGYPEQSCAESRARTDIGLPYNRTKILGERLVEQAHGNGLPTTVIRPATIFGPRSAEFAVEFGALLLSGTLPLIQGGDSQAGLVYVDDVARAMITAAHSPATIGGVYNVRDPEPMTWREYANVLATAIGARPPRLHVPMRLAWMLARASEAVYRMLGIRRRPLLTRHAVLILTRPQDYSIARAETEFGFRTHVGLGQGISLTADWLTSEEGRRALGR